MSEIPEGSGLNLILDDLHTRVSAIAEMYSLLYQDEQLHSIRLDQYLKKIVSLVTRSYSKIKLDSRFEDVLCSTNYAIPAGIITAELLTNAAKYAYSPTDEKYIKFRLAKEDQNIRLTISDRGKGIPPTLDVENSPTMGFKLVHALNEQIRGTLTLDSTNGTKWTLNFTAVD